MSVSIAGANIKASGELAVGPLFSGKDDTPSTSSIEKDSQKGGKTSGFESNYELEHATGLPKYTGTFETISDDSYYTPIDDYEGKHRYDPKFEWEPKEEKKLVRKVGQSCNRRYPYDDYGMLICIVGHTHLCLGLPNVLRPPTGSRQHLPSLIRQHA